jgi:hypothetical protein
MSVVESDTAAEWKKLGDLGDAIPDPMVIRTAELWLNGRSGCGAAGLGEDSVWDAISRNVGALLTFFDAYIGRDSLPLIQYWETFAKPQAPLEELLPGFFHPAAVDGALYNHIKQTVTRGVDRRVLLKIPEEQVADVLGEVTAYDHQWQPWVDIDLPGDRLELARYVVGGLVFGAYAQATGGDHLVQPKRSRLLVALSAPRSELSQLRFEQEAELFATFSAACATNPGVDVDDGPGMPSVLPYLLRKPSLATSTGEIVGRAKKLRTSRAGESYREWQKRLRHAWTLGTTVDKAEDDVALVAEKLTRRIATGTTAERPKLLTLSVTVPIGIAAAKAEREVKEPRWLSRWVLDNLHFRSHRRLLYRLALDERSYRDITKHLYQVWAAS